MKLSEINNQEKIQAMKKFVGWVKQRLDISGTPRIKLTTNKKYVTDKRTFGTTSSAGEIWVYIENRNLADILRTLCHELVHFKQFSQGTAHDDMDEQQHQQIEDEANALAGRLMRDYGKQNVEIYEGRTGSLTHDVADSLPYAYVIPELNSGNPYRQYKFGVAIAGVRGAPGREQDKITKFNKNDLDQVFADSEVVVSFDPNIDKVIDQALKDIGFTANKKIVGVKGSKESSDVTAKSPISSFRGYPR